MRIRAILFVLAMIPSAAVAQQGFTCSYGDRGACLGYGDTVCSSSGKCVNESAACFDSYQCNYEGFTCKSNVTACADEYDGLQTRFNTLVNDYNKLLEDSRDMRAGFQSALEDLDDTKRDLRGTEETLYDIRSCIEGLGRLEDPTNCLP